ncbi:hypothetical protein HaLaN_03655 [Haematococcus lacustris]|uniref:Uncharacterized protein n=1 Tax=Haematococcus lacustris TaxID=44745 RepID=A0A699YGW0_HAELA|nr:hypothetical protein HaLaN_03655 [Haematococcus lacustris]
MGSQGSQGKPKAAAKCSQEQQPGANKQLRKAANTAKSCSLGTKQPGGIVNKKAAALLGQEDASSQVLRVTLQPLGPFPLTLPCPITNTSKSPTSPLPPSPPLSPDIVVPSLPYPAARREPPLVPLLPAQSHSSPPSPACPLFSSSLRTQPSWPPAPWPLSPSLCCPTTTTSQVRNPVSPDPSRQPGAGSLEPALLVAANTALTSHAMPTQDNDPSHPSCKGTAVGQPRQAKPSTWVLASPCLLTPSTQWADISRRRTPLSVRIRGGIDGGENVRRGHSHPRPSTDQQGTAAVRPARYVMMQPR